MLRFERRVCRWESCRMHHFNLRFWIYDLRAACRVGAGHVNCKFPCRVGPTTRGAPLRPERLKVEILHAVPAFALRASAAIWNVNRTSEPGPGANECAPGNGSVVRVHGIPPLLVDSSKLMVDRSTIGRRRLEGSINHQLQTINMSVRRGV